MEVSPCVPRLADGDGRSSLAPALDHKVSQVSLLMARQREVLPGRCPQNRAHLLPFSWVLSPSCCRNAEKILGYLHTNVLSRDLIPPHVNFSHLTTKDYTEMYKVIRTVKEDHFSALGLDPCLLEDELDKVWDRLPFPDGLGGGQAMGLICVPDKQGPPMCPDRERGEVSAQTPALRRAESWWGDEADTHHRNPRKCVGRLSCLLNGLPVHQSPPHVTHSEQCLAHGRQKMTVYSSACPLLSVPFGPRDMS